MAASAAALERLNALRKNKTVVPPPRQVVQQQKQVSFAQNIKANAAAARKPVAQKKLEEVIKESQHSQPQQQLQTQSQPQQQLKHTHGPNCNHEMQTQPPPALQQPQPPPTLQELQPTSPPPQEQQQQRVAAKPTVSQLDASVAKQAAVEEEKIAALFDRYRGNIGEAPALHEDTFLPPHECNRMTPELVEFSTKLQIHGLNPINDKLRNLDFTMQKQQIDLEDSKKKAQSIRTQNVALLQIIDDLKKMNMKLQKDISDIFETAANMPLRTFWGTAIEDLQVFAKPNLAFSVVGKIIPAGTRCRLLHDSTSDAEGNKFIITSIQLPDKPMMENWFVLLDKFDDFTIGSFDKTKYDLFVVEDDDEEEEEVEEEERQQLEGKEEEEVSSPLSTVEEDGEEKEVAAPPRNFTTEEILEAIGSGNVSDEQLMFMTRVADSNHQTLVDTSNKVATLERKNIVNGEKLTIPIL